MRNRNARAHYIAPQLSLYPCNTAAKFVAACRYTIQVETLRLVMLADVTAAHTYLVTVKA
jgi:hypothetical protein